MKIRKLLAALSLCVLASCSSASKNPNACVVQTLSGSISGETSVEDGAAFVGAGCITGRFGCKWKETKFDGDWITIEGKLSSLQGRVASFVNDEIILKPEKSLAAAITSLAGNRQAVWTDNHTLTIRKGSDEIAKYQYSPACTKKEAALGVVALYYN